MDIRKTLVAVTLVTLVGGAFVAVQEAEASAFTSIYSVAAVANHQADMHAITLANLVVTQLSWGVGCAVAIGSRPGVGVINCAITYVNGPTIVSNPNFPCLEDLNDTFTLDNLKDMLQGALDDFIDGSGYREVLLNMGKGELDDIIGDLKEGATAASQAGIWWLVRDTVAATHQYTINHCANQAWALGDQQDLCDQVEIFNDCLDGYEDDYKQYPEECYGSGSGSGSGSGAW